MPLDDAIFNTLVILTVKPYPLSFSINVIATVTAKWLSQQISGELLAHLAN